MEVASLGLKIQVEGVEQANKGLDKLIDNSTSAEKAVTDLGAAAEAASKKTKKLDDTVTDTTKAVDGLDKSAEDAAKSTDGLGDAADKASKSTKGMGDGLDKATKSTKGMGDEAEKARKSTKGMGDSADKATTQVDEMGKKAASTERGVSSFASAALKAGAVLAAAFSVSSIAKYADAWSDMQSKVGAATKDMEGAAGMMTRLVDIANASYSPLEQTVSTYSRNVTVLRDLGKSSSQAADYVESLNNMLVLTATRGERAASVQDALSKALATGKLEADGLETVLANGGEVAAALARELNTTTSGLRGLASQGKVTGKVIADAMIKSLDDVRERAAAMPATITDSFVILTNNVTEFVGRLDKASGASAAIAGVIIDFAGWLRKAGDYAIALGALLAPVFEKIGSVLSVVADNSAVVGVALAGFAAPAVIGGIASLATAIGVGLLGAVRAVSAAMLANPLGLLVAGAAAAGYAIYKFRDQISQALGFDVGNAAKTGANLIIGSFAAAYEDIKFVWNGFGDMMGAAVIGGINIAIRSINFFIQGAISGVNNLIEAINKIPGVDVNNIGKSVGVGEIDNPYAARLGVAVDQRNAAVKAAMSRDYVGDISQWLGGIGKGGAAGGGDGGSGKPGGAAGGKSAATVAIEAETDAIKKALKDQVGALEDAMEKNEYLYSLGIRNAEDYYLRKAYLGRESGLAEAKAAEQEISVIDKALKANKLTEDQRKKLLEDRRKLVNEVGAANVKAINAEISAEEAAARKRTGMQKAMTDSARSAASSAAEQANALALQVEQYDMTATAIAYANVARAEEELAIQQTTRAMAAMRGERAEDLTLMDQEIEATKNRVLALKSAAKSTSEIDIKDKAKEFAAEAKKNNEQIGESLTDALLRGFEDGKGFAKNFKDTMINLFKTMVLKPIIQPIAQGAAGMVTGALGLGGEQGGATGGGSSLLGSANNLSSIGGTALQAYGGLSVGASAASLGAANVAGAFGADALGTLIAANGSWAGVSVGASAAASAAAGTASAAAGTAAAAASTAATTTSALAGAMSTIGAAMPYIGAAIAIYTLLSGSFKGEKRSGGTFNWADGQSSFLHGPSGGTDGKADVVNAAINATAGGVNSLLKAAGSALSVTNLIAGFEGSEKGRGGVMSGVTLSNGTRIGEDGTGSNYKGTYYNKNLPTTLTTEAAAGLLVTDLKQLQIEVLQSADDIPGALRKLVDGVNAVSLSDEAATELLGQISAQVAAVEGFRAMVASAGAPLAKFKELSYDLTVAFVDASGGLEAAQSNLNSFYETYHTEDERMADTLSAMTTVFKDLGLAVPSTKEEFRSLVEGLSLTDEAAVRARATLLGMNQTFAGWADYAAATAKKLADDNKKIADDAKAVAAAEVTAYQNFLNIILSDTQKATLQAEALRNTFTSLGVAMPTTLEGLRALVDAQDPTIESQKTLRDALIAVAPQMAAFIKSIDDTAKTAAATQKTLEDTFVSQYHTDAEKLAETGRTLAAAFRALGVDMPDTTQQLRAMIDAGGSTRQGLLELSSSFYTFSTAMANAKSTTVASTLALIQGTTGAGAVDTATKAAQTALAGLQASINAQKNQATAAFEAQSRVLQAQINNANAGVALYQRVNERVKSTLQTLIGQFDPVGNRKAAQQLISNAARTGNIGDPVALENALGLIAQPSEELFGSFSDYQLDFLRTANDVDKLNGITGKQLSIEQQTLDTLTNQLTQAQEQHQQTLAKLDNQLLTAQQQLQVLLGTDTKILSMSDALKELADAMKALAAAQAGATPGAQINSWYDKVLGRTPDAAGADYWKNQIDKNGVAPTQAEFANASQSELWLNSVYKAATGRLPDAEGRSFWLKAMQDGFSRAAIEASIYSTAEATKYSGSHFGGLDSVPFDGYMAKLHKGERVKTASEARAEDLERAQQGRSTGLMADEASLRVLQQILVRVADISAETKATAQNTGRTARLQDRWDGDGLPPVRDEIE